MAIGRANATSCLFQGCLHPTKFKALMRPRRLMRPYSYIKPPSYVQQLPSSSSQSRTGSSQTIAMAFFTRTGKISTTPFAPPTIYQTLSESFRLPTLCIKATVGILLLLLIPSTILFFASSIVLAPLFSDFVEVSVQMSHAAQGSPEYNELVREAMEDMRKIVGNGALLSLATNIVSLVAAIATIYASVAVYYGEELGTKELFSRIAKGWKQPLVTCLYIKLFELGFWVFISLSVGFTFLLSYASSFFTVIGIVVLVMGFIFYLHLGVIWTLGLVVAVVEEDCYGLAAFGRAGLLLRGRKMQGLALHLLFLVVTIFVFSWPFFLPMSFAGAVRLGLGSVAVAGLLHSAVFSVFYFGCKVSHGEEVHGKEFLGYSLVPTAAHADSALM